MFCNKCGTQIVPGKNFCPKCGAAVSPSQAQSQGGGEYSPYGPSQGQPSVPGRNMQGGPGVRPGGNPAGPNGPGGPQRDGSNGVLIALIAVASVLLVFVLGVGAFLIISPSTKSGTSDTPNSSNEGSEQDTETSRESDDEDIGDPTTMARSAKTAKEYANDSGLDLDKEKDGSDTIWTGYDESLEVGTPGNGKGYYVYQGKKNEGINFCGIKVGMSKNDAKDVLEDGGYNVSDKSSKLKTDVDDEHTLTCSYEDDTIKSLDYVYNPQTQERTEESSSSSSSESESTTQKVPESRYSEEQSSGGSDSSYIIPYSDSQYLEYDDVAGLSDDEIQTAINEIYARHGCTFERGDVQAYFNNKTWYSPTNVRARDYGGLTSIEQANIDYLSNFR